MKLLMMIITCNISLSRRSCQLSAGPAESVRQHRRSHADVSAQPEAVSELATGLAQSDESAAVRGPAGAAGPTAGAAGPTGAAAGYAAARLLLAGDAGAEPERGGGAHDVAAAAELPHEQHGDDVAEL